MKIYDKTELEDIVKKSLSISQVCRYFNITPAGGNFKTIKNYIKKYDIDISHFTGKGWNVGERFRDFCKKISLDDILVENSTYTNTTNIKNRLVKEGLKQYKCEECGITEWNGKKISLHLDHKNGNNLDNRIENLRILCPNCHSQTETYCNSKICNSYVYVKKKKLRKSKKLKSKINTIKATNYCKCGKEIDKRSKQCKSCTKLEQKRKVEKRPSIDELILMVKELGYCETGRKYNVSDNTIRKWLKKAV